MPTSSLKSIAGLLRTDSLKGMAAVLGLQPPTSAKQVRAQASFSFLPGWQLVTDNGIAKDEANNVWHTGHLEDVLPLESNRLLLAAHSGGVWLASRDEQSKPTPLSNSWPKVGFHCLGFGTRGPKHVYAGGEEGALFETETQSLASLARFSNTKSVREVGARLNRTAPISVRQLLGLSDAPIFDWKPISLVDSDGNSLGITAIYQVLCVTAFSPAKLVLATLNGVFWSDIPPAGHEYRFALADGIPPVPCLGLALAPQVPVLNAHVVCSPKGDPATPDSNGIYFGTWQFDGLTMRRANHVGDFDFVQWKHAVVASSASDRSILYAAVSSSGKATLSLKRAFQVAGFSGPLLKFSELAQQVGLGPPASMDAVITKLTPPIGQDLIYAVISSKDGGATWFPIGPNHSVADSVGFDAGSTQDGYNMSIAVSNASPDTVALGWRGGPHVGRNKPDALTWEKHFDAFDPNIHTDAHGLHFDPRDPQGKTLYMCSDGGVIFTTDLGAAFTTDHGATFKSFVNRFLPVLQFQSYPGRQANGASGVSFQTPGLVAGPLQDNGVVFSFLQDGVQRPGQRITVEDDGEMGIFLKNDLLLFWNNDNPVARAAKWNGSQFDAAINVTVRTPSPTVPTGSTFSNPLVEPVFHSQFQRPDTQQTLVAVAADTSIPPRDLWGLFTDADGSNPHWEFLTTIGLKPGDSVTAVASNDGLTVLVGSQQGEIFSYDVESGALSSMQFEPSLSSVARFLRSTSVKDMVSKLNLSPPVSVRNILRLAFQQQVFQFEFQSNGLAIARYASGLLRFEPAKNAWTSIQGNGLPSNEGPLYFMAVDAGRGPAILYVATDYGVHASWDAGENWLPVSQGLPVRSRPSTLRFVTEPTGDRQLYLFTFGRSAWRAQLN